MTNIQNAFATNVRRYRKAARLSQEKLAEIAGLHRTYIGGIEQRRVNVSLKNIEKIATALDVDPALLFLSDDDTASEEVAVRKQELSRLYKPLEHAPKPDGGNTPPDHALVSWQDGHMVIRPIEVSNEDLTVQVLVGLVEQGYSGDELAHRYDLTNAEIKKFLSAR